MDYRRLKADKIIEKITLLQRRIEERFPGAGLSAVCEELLEIGQHARERSAWIAKPIIILRVVTVVLILLIVAGVIATLLTLRPLATGFDFVTFVQLLEAGINDLVLIGAGIFFLTTMETRIKRQRALSAIHELRAIAHIIDMHQLTKDPAVVLAGVQSTASSPKRTMTAAQLSRYFDYCSEMLALAGKVAALYIQDFNDEVAIAAVNEVETLTTGLSRKIWQKMMILLAAGVQQ